MVSRILILFSVMSLMACSHTNKNSSPQVSGSALETGKRALQQMTGCYLVDYNYVETEGLKRGYKKDNRVYDVNKTKAVKEWIYLDEVSDRRLRLQHVLFAIGEDGQFVKGSELKHQAEDWEFEAPYLYEFTGPSQWKATQMAGNDQKWTRRITNLDDGLRYQCAANWTSGASYPQWTCDNYAPIPGRETRDMKRKDYNTLQRSTRIIVYGDSWLERQDNVKTIHEKNKMTPLAKETGKNWYVRLPDSDCAPVQAFVKERREFWKILRESWDQVYADAKPFNETSVKDQPPRFAKMMELEEKFLKQDLGDEKVRKSAQDEIQKIISQYRLQDGVKR